MDTERSSREPLPHDAAYKAICSHPKVIEHTLRGYLCSPKGPLSGQTLGALDFATLEKVPTAWVSEDFRNRHGDQAWRVRFRWAKNWNNPAHYLLITLEFQSQADPDMAVRIGVYTLELYRELRTRNVVKPGGVRPPVLPLVFHNGDRRWRASTDLADLTAAPMRKSGTGGTASPADAGPSSLELAPFQLRQSHFVLDFRAHRQEDLVPGNLTSLLISLEQARSMEALTPLLHSMAEVPDESLRRGLFRWLLLLGARHNIEMPPIEELEKMASIDNFHSKLDERMGRWTQEWFAEGRAEGRAEGMANQRAMLAHQASVKFGPAAEEFDRLLAKVGSSKTLTQIGEWLLTADTASDLTNKVRASVGDAAKH